MRVLAEAEAFVFPSANIVGIVKNRSVKPVEQLLGYEYDWPVTVLRVVDTATERFNLGNLYKDRFPVVSVLTKPEIEILVIINEGKWASYQKLKSRVKPSDYCKRELCMPHVKSRSFLESYWDADSLVKACFEYCRLRKRSKGELFIADVLKRV